MIRKLVRVLVGRLGRGPGSDPRWLEIGSGSLLICWGIGVLMAPELLGACVAPDGLLGMFVPPMLMGALLMMIGALQVASVLMDHQVARVPFAAAAASGCFLFGMALGSITPLVLGLWNAAAMLLLIRLYQAQAAP